MPAREFKILVSEIPFHYIYLFINNGWLKITYNKSMNKGAYCRRVPRNAYGMGMRI
jgi:hypothetical protein